MTIDRTAADVLLSDGSLAVVRSLTPEGTDALHDLHDRVSDGSAQLRFFTLARAAAHKYVDHVLEEPYQLALVAEVDGRLAGFATAEPLPPHLPHVAEVAFLAADDFQGHGLGTLLLEHLAALARDRGIREFEANVLPSNQGMLRVLDDAGFRLNRCIEEGVEIYRFDTAVTAEAQAAEAEREARLLR
ncbi:MULTISPECIES: GNAT family N-acetyltransferase [Nocardioides]|uniref:GNAT family N-acetyltransferase n=1 Tax=Nocardioides vastitatis TaxID=2568655 RepID=A0ABW0ZLB9_9ACTN|nr:GNAT family N-acetyltransferase [Nocardioides sp.]THJ06228.1 GNAT family N-acetyltransferase [Nocardioides sp.]